ncbi:MAG: hypothetical protein ACPGMR_11465 [Pontibacterium sp.]
MPRKHPGINQKTGRLKKGYKYGANGNPVKAGTTTTKRKRKASPKSVVSKVKTAVRKVGRKLKVA